jgi:hypothetical protein
LLLTLGVQHLKENAGKARKTAAAGLFPQQLCQSSTITLR